LISIREKGMEELTLEMAERMLEAAIRWARDVAHTPCSVAVVDKSGALIAVYRMDGAAIATTWIAIEKAWSAVSFKLPTLMLSRWLDPRSVEGQLGAHALGMAGRGGGRLCFIPGGIPITNENNEIIGGIGTSGIPSASGDISDTSVSQSGITALYD
jgi:glc operon protein GlcG